MPVIELKIPNLGESITNVTFSKWLKPDGSIADYNGTYDEYLRRNMPILDNKLAMAA